MNGIPKSKPHIVEVNLRAFGPPPGRGAEPEHIKCCDVIIGVVAAEKYREFTGRPMPAKIQFVARKTTSEEVANFFRALVSLGIWYYKRISKEFNQLSDIRDRFAQLHVLEDTGSFTLRSTVLNTRYEPNEKEDGKSIRDDDFGAAIDTKHAFSEEKHREDIYLSGLDVRCYGTDGEILSQLDLKRCMGEDWLLPQKQIDGASSLLQELSDKPILDLCRASKKNLHFDITDAVGYQLNFERNEVSSEKDSIEFSQGEDGDILCTKTLQLRATYQSYVTASELETCEAAGLRNVSVGTCEAVGKFRIRKDGVVVLEEVIHPEYQQSLKNGTRFSCRQEY